MRPRRGVREAATRLRLCGRRGLRAGRHEGMDAHIAAGAVTDALVEAVAGGVREIGEEQHLLRARDPVPADSVPPPSNFAHTLMQ
jgi:hypothetical protein